MDDQLVLAAVHSLEERTAVAAAGVAAALESTEAVVARRLDRLVASGALRTSVLRCRRNEGYAFTTRAVWYHSPEHEVTERFGSIAALPEPRVSA
jgi:hypothetical protein